MQERYRAVRLALQGKQAVDIADRLDPAIDGGNDGLIDTLRGEDGANTFVKNVIDVIVDANGDDVII